MQQLSARQLKQWLDDPARRAPQLLDVREPWEFETCRIDGALLVPMRTVPAQFGQLDPDAATVVICHRGMRSMQVAAFLERQGFAQVFNLSGGVAAWADEVDPTMRRY